MVNREKSARNLATEARIACLRQQGERCADEVAQGGAGAGPQGAEEGLGDAEVPQETVVEQV